MQRTNYLKTALISALMLLAVNLIMAQTLSVSISSQTNASCYGVCDGSLTAAASGGTGGPYTYSWSQGSTAPAISALCAGSYTCTVGDGVSTATVAATITEPPTFIPLVSNNAPVCNGQTLNFTSSFAASWSWVGPNGYSSTLQNPSISTATAATAGTYTLTATNAGGCVGTATTNVTVNPTPTLTVNNGGMCSGNSFTLTANGALTYSWAPPNSLNNSAGASVTSFATSTTIYTVTGTSASGCTGYTSTTVMVYANPTAILTATNVSCNGACDGSVIATPSGGSPPYMYQWQTGPTTQSISGLCPMNYTCTITDINGCQFTATTPVTQPAAISASVVAQSATSCNGTCDGSATITASGGVPAYTFSWAPGGMVTAAVTGLCAGTYTATVTDVNGCIATQVVMITQPTAIAVSAPPQTYCSGSTAVLCASASGGVGAVSYQWSPSSCFSNPNASCATNTCVTSGIYTVDVTDANGCVGSAQVSLTIDPSPVLFSSNFTEPSCGGSNGSASFTGSSGSAPYQYTLTPPSVTNGTGNFSGLSTGSYTLAITDANGCSSYFASLAVLDSCEVVWSGDADNDLVANNYDILDIGLYYGDTWGPRPNANISWTGQPSAMWPNTKPNGYNEKHDDCDGNGTVDASDTTAVIQNYNLNHPPYKLKANTMIGTPLSIQFVQDTINNSGKADINIKLGSSSSPANNVYGIAFTLTIDTTIVQKDSTTLSLSNSWIGAGSVPFLGNKIENYSNGEIDVVLCRTDHNNVSGFGDIAQMSVTMKDDITGKLMMGATKTLNIGFTKVKIISATGDTVSYSAFNDSLVVDQITTYLAGDKHDAEIKLFPNPAQQFVVVQSAESIINSVEVYSMQGRKISKVENENFSSEMTIATSSFEKGIYLVKVHSAKSTKIFRLQII
jgi:hypothetical protein